MVCSIACQCILDGTRVIVAVGVCLPFIFMPFFARWEICTMSASAYSQWDATALWCCDTLWCTILAPTYNKMQLHCDAPQEEAGCHPSHAGQQWSEQNTRNPRTHHHRASYNLHCNNLFPDHGERYLLTSFWSFQHSVWCFISQEGLRIIIHTFGQF